MSPLLALALAAMPVSDAPLREPPRLLASAVNVVPVVSAQAEGRPKPLQNAERLANELRYEEAVVEYQRYLALPDRPVGERARALFDLAFIHLVLGDELSARQRAFTALELDPTLRLPSDAPSRQQDFLQSTRQQFESRARVEVLPPENPDAPERIRARLVDPKGKAHTVLLRHALGPQGPFWGQQMICSEALCTAEIPSGSTSRSMTAWYYVEVNDAQGNTLATGASPDAPLRVSVVRRAAWYESPWVYAGGAAAVIGAAAVFFVASAPTR